MTNIRGLSLSVPAMSILLTLSPVFQPEQGSRATSLQGESRLARPVTIQERYTTVGDLFDRLEASLGVKIRAVPGNFADRNILVMARERPAAEVLEVLARLFQAEWRIAPGNGQGYELRRTERALAEEARLRRTYLKAIRTAIDAQVRRIRNRQTIKKPELLAQLDSLWRDLRSASFDVDQKLAMRAELDLLSAAANSVSGPLVQLLASLTDAEVDGLLHERVLRFSSSGHSRMSRLPGPIAQALLQARPDDDREWYTSAQPPRDVRAELRLQIRSTTATLLCRSQIVGIPPRGEAPAVDLPVSISVNIDPAVVGPNTDQFAGKEEKLKRRVTVKLAPKRITADDPSTYVAATTLSDVVEAIHREAPDVSFVADVYLNSVSTPTPATTSLRELLNEFGSRSQYSWQYDARGYVILNNRLAFLDGPRAIPAPSLRSVMGISLKSRGLGLFQHAQLAHHWSDDQLRSLRDRKGQVLEFLWPPLSSQVLTENRGDLRLLASLGQDMKALVESGAPISLARLNTMQQRAVVQALDSVWYVAPTIELFTESEFQQGTFRLLHEIGNAQPREFEFVYSMGPPSRAVEKRRVKLVQANPYNLPQ